MPFVFQAGGTNGGSGGPNLGPGPGGADTFRSITTNLSKINTIMNPLGSPLIPTVETDVGTFKGFVRSFFREGSAENLVGKVAGSYVAVTVLGKKLFSLVFAFRAEANRFTGEVDRAEALDRAAAAIRAELQAAGDLDMPPMWFRDP